MPNNQAKSAKSKQQQKPPKQGGKQKKQSQAMMVTTMTTAPVAKGYNGAIKSANYRSGKEGKVVLCHSELVGDVVGTADFTVTTRAINAGLQDLFLWLSNIAMNYESYQFKKLKFRYLTACSTDNPGSVYISVDFDPTDPVPTTERQLANYQDTRFCAPWRAETYNCSASNLKKRSSYYVRGGPISTGENISLFDTGYLIIATVGCPLITVGKLWVDYEVEFSTPDFPLDGVGRALSSKFSTTGNYVTDPTKLGDAPLTATIAANVLTLTSSQPYQGLLGITINGTGLTTITVNGTGTEVIQSQTVNPAATQITALITLNFTAALQTFTLTITAPTTVTTQAIRIGQYSVSVNA